MKMEIAAFLRGVPVLAGLPDELLARLSREVETVEIGAGEWLFREGEPAGSMFIVGTGRMQVIDEGPPETLVRVLRRGEMLGELALLRTGERSASARAARDTRLLELDRGAFERLVLEVPSFALGVTRAMGAQLAASRAPIVDANRPRTIAVVGLDSAAPAADAADMLVNALGAHGSVASLRSGELETIDRAERDNERVVLQANEAADAEWTDLCLREADLVVATTSGAADPAWLERATALRGCELLVVGSRLGDGMLEALQPRQVQVIADLAGHREALHATARRLAGRSLGVVLSGGGARALAHLGVLDELEAAGLRFDRLAGVSLGALVAAFAAAGFPHENTYRAFEQGFVETNPTSDYAVPAYSLIRGAKTRRLLGAAFGERRIEELSLRFFSLSCDLVTRQAVIHRVGPLADAVYASLAIPGVFPPVATADGRLLVDGGVLDNLPVATMARSGEGPVIAVDVAGRTGAFRSTQGRTAAGRLAGPVRRLLTGSEAEIPRLGETLVRTLMVGSTDTVAAARAHADLVITPVADSVGLMDWRALPRVVELGRRAAREALAANPDLVERLTA